MEGFLVTLFSAIFLGGGSRIHTVFIGEDSSILGTWNFWWTNYEKESRCIAYW